MDQKRAKNLQEFFDKLEKLCVEYNVNLKEGGIISGGNQIKHTVMLTHEDYRGTIVHED